MPLSWLLYISKSMVGSDRLDEEISRIVTGSCKRNADRGITGAMIATEDHFAQYMEGSTDAVEALFARICGDTRHADPQIIDRGRRRDRLFPEWSMAYSGGSVFMRRSLAEALQQSLEPRARARRLINLMREFARQPLKASSGS